MQWCGTTTYFLSPLPCKVRAPLHSVFLGGFNIEAKYTHMFVYQDAQVPTSFGLQSLRRKARFLLWQRWLGDEASMFMDTSLFGSSPPCILRFASTVS